MSRRTVFQPGFGSAEGLGHLSYESDHLTPPLHLTRESGEDIVIITQARYRRHKAINPSSGTNLTVRRDTTINLPMIA